MRAEVQWWRRAAERDLAMGENLTANGFFEGAAFHAQQAAEKSLKAALIAIHGAWQRTHSAVQLLRELEARKTDIPEPAFSAARRLDVHYIDSRYPNGVGGSPDTFFDESIANRSLLDAQLIIDLAEKLIAKEKNG